MSGILTVSPLGGLTVNGGNVLAGSLENLGLVNVNRGTLGVGTATLDPASMLSIGLGGTIRGSQFGAFVASGNFTLAGELLVTADGFTPVAGESFDILDWGAVSGTFSAIDLPLLGGGLTWDTSQLLTTGVISVGGVAGDYNHNGTVDAADYTLWRDTLGQSGIGLAADGNGNGVVDGADYDIWRMHYGQSASGGSAAGPSAAVPEPSSWWMLLAGILTLCSRRQAVMP